nr:DUF1905 domain-containing protein [uncultured Gellertiella sp.]
MGPDLHLSFQALLWLYPGKAAWHFLTLPEAEGGLIRMATGPRHGFGSVRVLASIGATSWKTSIFPDKASGSFLLPVKAEVRKREKLVAGVPVPVSLIVNA